MFDRDLQDSAITHCERTGEPPSAFSDKPVICSVCQQEISTGEHYGRSDKVICMDCVNEEFKSFTDKEKLDVLGYLVEWNG